MAKSWKFYQADAEQFRAYNVFTGPLDTEAGDVFLHYLREGKLGHGTDYFGIYCEDHATWLSVQPQDLKLKEITAKKVPSVNAHTKWAKEKAKRRMVVEDIGIEWDAVEIVAAPLGDGSGS